LVERAPFFERKERWKAGLVVLSHRHHATQMLPAIAPMKCNLECVSWQKDLGQAAWMWVETRENVKIHPQGLLPSTIVIPNEEEEKR
jgi:hypothetical protein